VTRGDDGASRGDGAMWEEAAMARHEKGWWQREQGRQWQREQRLRWQGGGQRGAGEEEDGGVWAQVRPEDAGRRSSQWQQGIIDGWAQGSMVGLGIQGRMVHGPADGPHGLAEDGPSDFFCFFFSFLLFLTLYYSYIFLFLYITNVSSHLTLYRLKYKKGYIGLSCLIALKTILMKQHQ
jgi:hypothetical protein